MTNALTADQIEDVAEVLAMPDDEFRTTVLELLGEGVQNPDWQVLLAPQVCRRTKATLRSIGEELGDIRDPDLRKTFGRLSQRARLAVLHAAQSEHWALAQSRLAVIGALATAVAEHRSALVGAGYEPEDHDRALWATLADLTVETGGDTRTLDEAIGAGVWAAKEVLHVD